MTFPKLTLLLLVLAAITCTTLTAQTSAPATQSATPIQITPQDPTSIQRAIQAAIDSHQPSLTIPPGIYEIPGADPIGKRNFHLRVTNAQNLTITATGVTLVFTDRYQHSLGFFNCKNVTLRGATLQRKTCSTSQGTIEAIRDDGKSIDVRIDKGYPTDIDNRTLFTTFWTSVFTMDRSRWLAHYRAATPPVMQKLEPDLFRIAMNESAKQIGVNLQVGQPLFWRGEVFDDLRTQNCSDMKIIDVTVQGGSGMAFHEMGGGGGNLYRNCKLTYPPLPPGANQKPLFSSSADGLHSGDTRRGPIIENCLFEGVDDDAIAIHGTYACLIQSTDNRIVIWRAQYTSSTPNYALPGDSLRFYDSAGTYQSDRKVTAVRQLKDFTLPADYKPNKEFRFFSNPTNAYFVELTLDQPLAAQPNWLVCNANEMGSNYIVRNTLIRNTGSRGIMAKASDGLIENNTIEHTARAAIEFMPEHIVWPESDYAHNIIIRNNTIRDVSYNRQEGFLRQPGALTIFAFRSGGVGYLPPGHRNILIENNTFEDNNGPNLLIASADNVTVRNNRFLRPMLTPSKYGLAKKVNPEALIFVTQSRNVSFSHNTVQSPGPGLKTLIDLTPTTEVTGQTDGILLIQPTP